MARKYAVAAALVLLFVGLMAPPAAAARNQDGLLSGILGSGGRLLNIQGILYCTLNGTTGLLGSATPVFSGAVVQLKCAAGNIVSSTTTDANGAFSILLNPLQFVLSNVLQQCKIVVPTPLSNCDSTLPAVGGLVSQLQIVGSILLGLLNVLNVIPSGFSFYQVL
ncbi:hypothetical protein DCAR_0832511 [Daucus carota subsp. sativus]|uniref:Uncharacterized protein n=1 Tax=Daucus carota subsp. sativus TaxID=79200 RepID=A0A175YP73_DAUCS|nr:PREDICTED: phylloplanin-like [Daucus carota subsp. sativus]XP_017222020.1 PREDICTED: phylloplanin-like [Daucus carota subsp. sativus]WOH13002.1 hypothetical protein DCAR_0832511 [Daucus carota subsp. sativus]